MISQSTIFCLTINSYFDMSRERIKAKAIIEDILFLVNEMKTIQLHYY